MAGFGPACSPVVDRTLDKRQSLHSARNALAWAFVNLFLAAVVYREISVGSLVDYFSWAHPVVLYAEYALALWFTLNTLVDFFRYFGYNLYSVIVELTPKQKKLLAVKDNEPGFRVVTPKPETSGTEQGLVISPSSFSSFSAGSSTPIQSSPGSPYSPGAPIFSLGCFTPPSFAASFSHTPAPSPSSSFHYGLTPSFSGSFIAGPSSSYHDHSQSFSLSPQSSPSKSFSASFPRSSSGSPLSASVNLSPLFREKMDTSGLRSRLHNLSAKSSPMRSDDCIMDQKSFDSFIKEQEDRELRSKLASPDSSSGSGPSFWNYNRTLSNPSQVLGKYSYQIACRSPQSTKSHDTDPDDPNTYSDERALPLGYTVNFQSIANLVNPSGLSVEQHGFVFKVWSRVRVHSDELDFWVENLRKWISQTIMVPLVKEINKLNNQLSRLGYEELQVGEVSISMLKQVAVTKGQQIPSLNALVPYLEAGNNQEYLVMRIRELGSGGCMSDFKWNGGSEFKGKPWGEHLPSDSTILMHMICTYMDSRLPPHPRYPDGKTFTSQHFMTTPDKPDYKNKDNLLIYQSKINPPHYKVIVGTESWDIKKGRNNLFHTLLVFLHQIKTKENGMLGRVNLGFSGINVMWVLDPKV